MISANQTLISHYRALEVFTHKKIMQFFPFYDVYSSPYLVTFFIFALIETLLCSGITYGWASIVVVFKEERFYMELCRSFFQNRNKTRIVRSAVGYVSDGTLPGCPIQDSRLNLIFTISLFCLCGIKFPAGVFIDRCGPKIARSVGGYVSDTIIFPSLFRTKSSRMN